MKFPRPLILAALIPATVAAQPQGQAPAGLPPGIVRQGSVVMMQPIAESDTGAPAQSVFGGERRTPAVRLLTPADHDTFARAVAAALRGSWAEARGIAVQAH